MRALLTILLVTAAAAPAHAAEEVVTAPGATLRAQQKTSTVVEGPASGVTVRARACRRPATLRARIGGGPVATARVGGGWGVRRIALAVPAGRHRLWLAASGVRCRRGVQIAGISWRRTVEDPPVTLAPAPSPAPAGPAPEPAGSVAPEPAPPVPLGTAASLAEIEGDGRYRAALLEHFDAITPENELKMERLQPHPLRFDFSAADALMEFAEAHDLPVRGHTLVWGEQLPWYVRDLPFERETLIELMEAHIDTVVNRYEQRIDEWDVVNEAIAEDGRWRPSRWLELIGPEYVAMAFRRAHDVDPRARLYYNDYAAEAPGPKQDGIVRMLEWLLARDVPVHGVGMQMHTTIDGAPTEAQVRDTMRRYEALGLEVQVTEMDVALSGDPDTAPQRQAEVYARVARACRSVPACKRVTVWGVGDGHSWMGSGARALLLDTALAPKPAMAALGTALGRE